MLMLFFVLNTSKDNIYTIKMSRVSVKTKIQKDDALMESFNALLGDNPEQYDPFICQEKINEIKEALKTLIKYHDMICTYHNIKIVCDDQIESLLEFVNINASIKSLIDVNYNGDIAKCSGIYYTIKESKIIETLMSALKNLLLFKKYFMKDPVDDSFIMNHPGSTLYLIEYVKLNFKLMYSNPKCLDSDKKYFIGFVKKMITPLKKIYDVVVSPPINIKEFASGLIKGICNMESKIPGTKHGFAAIKKSVSVLENNFDKYYKDIAHSGNGAGFVFNFLEDVKKKYEGDTSVVVEVGKIMTFISGQIKGSEKLKQNPKLAKQFANIQNTYNKFIGILKEEKNDDEIINIEPVEVTDVAPEEKTEEELKFEAEAKTLDLESNEQEIENIDQQIEILKEMMQEVTQSMKPIDEEGESEGEADIVEK